MIRCYTYFCNYNYLRVLPLKNCLIREKFFPYLLERVDIKNTSILQKENGIDATCISNSTFIRKLQIKRVSQVFILSNEGLSYKRI